MFLLILGITYILIYSGITFAWRYYEKRVFGRAVSDPFDEMTANLLTLSVLINLVLLNIIK